MSVPGGAYRSILHRFDVIVGLVVVLAGAKTLFTFLPDISVSKVEVATATVREHADATPVEPSPPIELNIRDSQRDKLESPEATVLTVTTNNDVGVKSTDPAPSVVAPTATADVAATTSLDRLPTNHPLNDAQLYFERGTVYYRNGDLPAALADFDLAIQREPNFEDAYVNRGIVLYCMGKFDRAFADVAQAMRIGNSHRTATLPRPSSALSKKYMASRQQLRQLRHVGRNPPRFVAD
jgi:tetratricopeptide (TPR) repeat protein